MSTFLKNAFYRDVTKEYSTPVTTISVKLDSLLIHKRHFAYLCAYNMGKWKEIALGECSNGYCKIKNVVGDNIFRIARAQNGILAYMTDPFYVNMKGNISYFSSDTVCTKEVTLCKPRFYRGFHHWGGYWNMDSHLFQKVPTIAETDSTLTCRFPNNALIIMGTRWLNWQQRIYLMREDSVYKY